MRKDGQNPPSMKHLGDNTNHDWGGGLHSLSCVMVMALQIGGKDDERFHHPPVHGSA